MGTAIILIVILAVVLVAVRSSMKHMKGEGGCCGGGGDEEVVETKVLKGEKIGEKIIHIEGMHCDHCKNSVEKSINEIDGAVAKVNLKKNIAVVSMDREVPEDDLEFAVRRVGFKVVSIES